MPKSGLLFRFDITGKAVQDGLPSSPLLLDRMGLLAVEGDAHRDARGSRGEIDLGRAIAERVFDELVLDDLGVGPSEIEPHAAVLGLHTRGEFATLTEVDRSGGRVPIVGRPIPLLDVLGRRIGAPDPFDGGADISFDDDFHDRYPFALVAPVFCVYLPALPLRRPRL